jgi:hypothetical protein
MIETQDIVVIDSYAVSPQKQDELYDLISHFDSMNKDVCLVSHLPLPARMFLQNVKHAIYDANNLLGPEPLKVFCKVRDIELHWHSSETYHGSAVYINLYNALKLLLHKYAWIHFVEVDTDRDAIRRHLELVFEPLRNQPDVDLVAYPFFRDDLGISATGIVTTCFSCRPEIVQKLPLITTWHDYMRHCPSGKFIFLEELLWNVLSQTVNHRILDNQQIAHGSTVGGNCVVVKCPLDSGAFAVFVVNRTIRTQEIRCSTGQMFRLAPEEVGCVQNLTPEVEVVITEVETGASHRWGFHEMRSGSFKRPPAPTAAGAQSQK